MRVEDESGLHAHRAATNKNGRPLNDDDEDDDDDDDDKGKRTKDEAHEVKAHAQHNCRPGKKKKNGGKGGGNEKGNCLAITDFPARSHVVFECLDEWKTPVSVTTAVRRRGIFTRPRANIQHTRL